jgi:microcystin-dependent protein
MDAFVGEIRAVGFNFAPRNWAFCQGQILPINQYTALFSLLGTTYGGDGRSTFALPDLRGRAAVQAGQGGGLSNYPLGQRNGVENVTLLPAQLPAHTHSLGTAGSIGVTAAQGDLTSPVNNFLAATNNLNQYGEESTTGATMNPGSVTGTGGVQGGSAPHPNMMPYETINYIIALVGIFPPRS